LTGVEDCREVELQVIRNPAGNLAVIENPRSAPFPIERVFFVYDVPEGGARGGHAHYRSEELLVPLAGSFEVLLDDGERKRTVRLDSPERGLHLPNMIWRELVEFSSGAICLAVANDHYDEADYIRDYEEFRALRST
jgi:WxcM-like, C-terminal